ncbi:MarR family transcriptional regulator [Kineosporia sp. J2-2]|uniref:MarR family transcriptional regulator n=1 Tax=Kineosporia corallincola TaxID=2835133 RepID=A0ABS5TS72_9ACTN|nr:MarR family transcriptional regulator [Kineosporia corallincola]MBT0773635.1 MarR family transcriptional regulator [Kineosporia corallincola]
MTESHPPRIRSLELLRPILATQRRAAEDWARSRGLTFEQAVVLGYLEQRPGAMQRDIVEMSQTTPANISLMLKTLEGRGLIERRTEQGDARSKRVYLTDDGVALVAGLNASMVEVDEAIFEPLDAAEMATLETLLTKVNSKLPHGRP